MQNTQIVHLNNAQEKAVHAPNGPLLIVAGAGTGKTRTLTSRIAYLIKNGMPGAKICAITFTNKAAKEMAERVTAMTGMNADSHNSPLVSTFHSFGARILRKECRTLGREPNFVIFDDHDSFALLKKVVKTVVPPKSDDPDAINISKKEEKEKTPVFFAQKISEIKNMTAALKELQRFPEKNADILTVFERYEAALLRNNAFDFDDLIEKPVAIFVQHPEILARYQRKFEAIFVDEYQDINPKQYELVSLLAKEHRNLSVVGDDEQTIYSWRYADIKTFLNFDKEWKGANVFFLEENYRSTGNVIRAAAAVVKNNRFRTPKNLWTQNANGSMIKLYEAWGENEEAEWIVREIQNVRSKNKTEEIGILYRTNAQSRAIEQALLRANMPYRIFGGLKFYERLEVKDAVAALRYAANDKDELAKERLEKNLTKRKFAAYKKKIEEAGTLPPLELMKIFMETFGYFDFLESHYVNADERQENVAELVAFASEFHDLPELLERLSLLQAADDMAGKKNSGAAMVNLMTVHLAKGLEFDSVFIAGVSEGTLPHGRSLDKEESMEEERRLMYVAMTRARKNLYISFFGTPSRFLSEIPPECIALAGVENSNRDDFRSDPWDEEPSISFD